MNQEPKVTLIDYSENAIDILVFTKSNRLKPGTTFNDIKCMSEKEKMNHLSYMFDTIKTSFEFVDYIFNIKGVTRAFTHQLVRTRTASFQQQSQRVVDARDFSHTPLPGEYSVSNGADYADSVSVAFDTYELLVDDDVEIQDARGILPTCIHTEITMKANLRTFSQMAETRLCTKTQGEYQDVFKKIVAEILYVHPWAAPLLQVHCVKYGTCAFPRYTECPVQKHCIDIKTVQPNILTAWEKNESCF